MYHMPLNYEQYIIQKIYEQQEHIEVLEQRIDHLTMIANDLLEINGVQYYYEDNKFIPFDLHSQSRTNHK